MGWVIAALAARQHGRVARWQLLPAGVSAKAIRTRLEAGSLHLLHRGVYAVGHVAPTQYGREMAAVLAAGPGAVLSHRSAAVLWELLPPRDSPVHVLRAGPRRDSRPGITVHRADQLPTQDVRHRHGIPVTAPTRTILDLAASRPQDLEEALNEALRRRLTDPASLLTRAVDRSGAKALRAALADTPGYTRSAAERRLIMLVRAAGLPRPQTNVRIAGFEVDAVWHAQRVIVEVDGYAWRQLTQQSALVIARLAATLAG